MLARSNAALAASNDIVAASFSGVWQEGLKAGPIGCYKAKNGGDVALVFGTPSDFTQKIMATLSHPAIDAIIGTDADVFQNAQLGIIEKMDPAKVPNLTGILPIFKDPYEGGRSDTTVAATGWPEHEQDPASSQDMDRVC